MRLLGILLVCFSAVPLAGADEPALVLSADEKGLLKLLNDTRATHKLKPLRPNRILFQVARAHSANMAKQKKMDHVLDGKKPADRVLAAGYNYRVVRENLAVSDDGDEQPFTLAEIHDGWMKSKVHRDNILLEDRKVDEVGIGVVREKDGKVWYTQVFGAR